MLGVYASPSAVFARLKERPVWLLPLVVSVVANLVATAVSTQYIDWQAQKEQAVERMQARGMPPDQIEKAVEGMERFYSNSLLRTGLPLISSLVTQLIAVFFLAFVYNLCLPLVGAGSNYQRTLSVVTHASLVWLPGAFVRILLILLKRSSEVTTSLLVVVPNVKTGFLAVILGRLDIFAIWQLILTGLGLKVVYDIKGKKSYWLVFAVWFALTVIFGVLAIIGGGPR